MKRLMQEEYYNRCMEIHKGKYTYHGDFINTRGKILITCPIHGDFNMTAKNHLNGQGCPKCGSEYAKNWRKGQYKEFIEESVKRFGEIFEFPNIETEYENSHSKITILCKKCGATFQKIACDHITSPYGGCTQCRLERTRENNAFTYDELQSLTTVPICKFEGKIYKAENPSIKCHCEIHGDYDVKLNTILNGGGKCQSCTSILSGEDYRKQKESFDKLIKEKFNDNFIYDIDTFVNMSVPMDFECKRCGYKFKRTPTTWKNRIHSTGCIICSAEKDALRKLRTTEDFINEASLIYDKGEYDYSNTKYIGRNKYVTIKCNKCGRTFTINAGSHLQGHGCPYHYVNKSKFEEEVLEYIKSIYNDEIFNNDRKVLNGDELDIIIPNLNIAFECDGLYWHNELNKSKDYHLSKTERCLNLGIRLYHIFEDEWLYHKEIVKSRIKNILGLCNNVIYARSCVIQEVSGEDSAKFLNDNHIQGDTSAIIKYGLYYNGTLVSLMTFGKQRVISKIQKEDNSYELIRFANKIDTLVVGGASKLLKHFIKTHNPKKIISYADRRWSFGNLYETIGFQLDHKSPPNYYYVVSNKRYHRFVFRKDILVKEGYDKDLTEHEIMLQRKIYRIYDCGTLCYKLEF